MKRNKMKLKNKVVGTILGVIASSLVFVAAPVSANASDCTAADPCMTYAEVDGSGSVVNVIVCQPSVCSQQFGGVHPNSGNRLVPQVAANPLTNDSSGTAGQMSRPEENRTVTLSENNTFTVKENNTVVQTIVSPEVEIVKTETSTTVTTTSINANFGNTTVVSQNGEGVLVNNPDYVKIDAVQVTNSQVTTPGSETNSTNITKETIVFEERKTQQEVVNTINQGPFNILKSKIAVLTRLLGEGGWFL
jgi:hypothetical protein